MRLKPLLALAPLACAGAAHAGPTPDELRLMFGHRIQIACLAQDPAYETSAMGRAWAAVDDFKGWSFVEQQPFSRCLRERRFLDKPLCDEVTGLDIYADENRRTATAAMAAILGRHDKALASADDVLYLQDVAWDKPERFACPATLPHHSSTAP